ncbi:MAG: CRTAC1 family protein [Balneolaceae bacterium]|nr:MAG: CRTAC1 family protein [Balneolaceae bacterium]
MLMGKIRLILILTAILIAAIFLLYQTGIISVFPKSTEPFYFIDATITAGLHEHRHPEIFNENPSYLEIMGGGVAVGDFDGDGFEDIFFATMPSFDPQSTTDYVSALFRNQGDGTFLNATEEAGLDALKGFPMGALFFDYNNNGLQDLYVAGFDGGQLYENRGGNFVDVTEKAGLSLDGLCGRLPCMAAAASATDYNKSGYLDLLVVNNVSWNPDDETGYGLPATLPFKYQAQPVFLFRNNGDGTFTNVSEEAGLTNKDVWRHGNDGKGLSAVWTDVNNDGWPDVYIANDTTPNHLYINNRDGTFREIAVSAGVAELKSSMGIDTADFNNNGHFDLITTNLEGDMVSLHRNYGNFRFDYVTPSTGLIPSGRGSGWGILFVDLDMSGHLDLVVANGALLQALQKERENENIFFWNTGNGSFRNVSEAVVHFPNDVISRGMAYLDVQNNGLPDLVISNIDGSQMQLLLNKTRNGNNRIRLDLEGVISNRDAIGSRVYIEREDGLVQNQILKAGNSYQSSSSKSLIFGLGQSVIKELIIEWPSGNRDVLNDLPVNHIIQIREGESTGAPAEIVRIIPFED